AFVENHRDVRTELALDVHRFFRAEEEKRAVEVRTEFDSVGFDLANFGEGKNLEAAGIGEDRERPVHEAMQAASVVDDFHAGTDREMVRVAENDLRAHLNEFAGVERFDAGL